VKAIRQISDQLGREEVALGIVRHRPIDEGFIEHAMEWCRGDRLDDVLADDSLSPGDFVRTMKQLIDLSRQLEAVFSNPDTLDQLRLAQSRLFRGVVALASTIEGGRA
jgi:ATP-dependent RNA helicase HelY